MLVVDDDFALVFVEDWVGLGMGFPGGLGLRLAFPRNLEGDGRLFDELGFLGLLDSLWRRFQFVL